MPDLPSWMGSCEVWDLTCCPKARRPSSLAVGCSVWVALTPPWGPEVRSHAALHKDSSDVPVSDLTHSWKSSHSLRAGVVGLAGK